eukprot:12245361-Alexandrium_andersonii.AAC.1
MAPPALHAGGAIWESAGGRPPSGTAGNFLNSLGTAPRCSKQSERLSAHLAMYAGPARSRLCPVSRTPRC